MWILSSFNSMLTRVFDFNLHAKCSLKYSLRTLSNNRLINFSSAQKSVTTVLITDHKKSNHSRFFVEYWLCTRLCLCIFANRREYIPLSFAKNFRSNNNNNNNESMSFPGLAYVIFEKVAMAAWLLLLRSGISLWNFDVITNV